MQLSATLSSPEHIYNRIFRTRRQCVKRKMSQNNRKVKIAQFYCHSKHSDTNTELLVIKRTIFLKWQIIPSEKVQNCQSQKNESYSQWQNCQSQQKNCQSQLVTKLSGRVTELSGRVIEHSVSLKPSLSQ